jgi:hypothetical protein
LSIGCTLAVAVAGPSIMEPELPGAPGQPPWTLDAHLTPYAAVGLAAAGIVLGAPGLLLTLRAMRAGWTVSPGLVLMAGVGAAGLISLTGPFGSSDFLSYAAYGRELVTGHNPYVVTPEVLARAGDPVARAVGDWAGTPSVYGALASGMFGLASLIGGTSARLTVWVLDVVNAAAFTGTGVLLDRLARDRPARLRAAVLWTCNPLLLQILVAGAHIDALAVFFAVAGIAVASSGAGAARGVAAGALVGCGCAVKPTMALVAVGLIAVSGVRTPLIAIKPLVGGTADPAKKNPSRPAAGWLACGFGVVSVADVVLLGWPGVHDAMRASGMVSVGSPWRVVRAVLSQVMARAAADDIVRWSAVLCAVALAVTLLLRLRTSRLWQSSRAGADGMAAAEAVCAGVAIAVVLAWLIAWPYVLPWYDSVAWALLALLPASRLDWVLLGRAVALGLAYLPARSAGVVVPAGLRWMEPVLRSAACPAALAAITVLLVFFLVKPGRAESGVPGTERARLRGAATTAR